MTELEKRFWPKVDVGEPNECWEWEAATNIYGYGIISRGSRDEGNIRAHRAAYMLEVEDPGDLSVLHHCDNPSCVNPNHLYAGTQSENMQDWWEREAPERGNVESHNVGEDHPQSKLTESEVVEIKSKLNRGKTHKEIAKEHGVTSSTISAISRGRSWSHINE